MLDDTYPIASDEGISWKAYREAENIKDETYIFYLAELLEGLKNKKSRHEREKREAIYFILKWIGVNSCNKEVPQILMRCLHSETNMHTIGKLLDYIREQEDYIPNYKEIIHYVDDKRWQIRRPAIDLLGKCKEKEVEIKLLDLLKVSDDKYEVGDICSALINVGTERSIPLLLEKVNDKQQWIRSSAYEALAFIGNPSIIPVFVEGLKDRFYCSKHDALIGLCRFADANYVEIIYDSVTKILSYNRILDANFTNNTTDLIEGMKFLNSHLKDTGKMEKLLKKIKNKWEVLSDEEREFLQRFFELKE
ncbi:HEAT repeat domain-containing protein [Alkalihalobacillus deserti]|uniref:HEAT repeat domain-containing protein n=1 Tax=Alkalihalobacillus deserti TaxID=2879466 RepID=UPI001D14B24F|nr:HEAT repeat domain-containing protein [Alkalihalobacillus deserti]